MVKRLEQVAALVVAAGLAIVSYWLFFSWMGADRRPPRNRSESAAGLERPLLGVGILDARQMGFDVVSTDGQPQLDPRSQMRLRVPEGSCRACRNSSWVRSWSLRMRS